MKNKKILIVCMFLLITLLFANCVFAYNPVSFSDEQIDSINKIYSNYSNDYKYFIYFVNASNKGILYCWNDPNIFFVQGTLYDLPTFEASESADFLGITLNCNTFEIESSATTHNKVGYHVLYSNDNILVYTNTNIYSDYNKEKFFFLQPPAKEILTLEEITEIAQAEIIPTLLTVIAVVVGLVILLIGFKKGFKILVNGLKI